jgi:Rrf2 family iron-sulfur cluster assembly transcriptional regulator
VLVWGLLNPPLEFPLITRETDYAIRATLYLAKQEDLTASVSTAELSEEMTIPYRFLRKIVSKLVASGLIVSRRGKGGGLSLGRAPQDISLMQIIHAVDPDAVLLNRCVSDIKQCDRSLFCGIHAELARMQKQLDAGLEGVTLASMSTHESAHD